MYIWAATWENRIFANVKTKTQISFAVTTKLISAFVFATRIVQSLYLLNSKFQASSSFLWLYSPVCIGPGRKPPSPVFWHRGSFVRRRMKIIALYKLYINSERVKIVDSCLTLGFTCFNISLVSSSLSSLHANVRSKNEYSHKPSILKI